MAKCSITKYYIKKPKIDNKEKKESNIKIPNPLLGDVRNYLCIFLKSEFPKLKFIKSFSDKESFKCQKFSLGNKEKRIVIAIDYGIFDDYYNVPSSETLKIECNKTLLALKSKYRCIRISHKILYEEREKSTKKLLDLLKAMVNNEIKNGLFFVHISSKKEQKIYKKFANEIYNNLHRTKM